MTTSNMTAMVSTLLAVTGMLVSGKNSNNSLSHLQLGCQGDMMGLVATCMMYIHNVYPIPAEMTNSASRQLACCEVLKTTQNNITCVCQSIPAQFEQMNIIDMAKIDRLCCRVLWHSTCPWNTMWE